MKNFTKMILAACLVTGFAFSLNAQSVGINATGDAPNGSAMLDVSSTSKGLLPPRMTMAQRELISSPVAGLIVWCSNCGTSGELQVYNGTTWTSLTSGGASILPDAPIIGTATAGNGQASVTFTAPAYNGGSTILSYMAISSPGGYTGTLTQAGSGTINVTGLTNSQAYTFTVTATNANGTSAASAASNEVTPAPFVIGQSFLGGKIAYIDGTGNHGLIAATEDQSTGIIWAIPAYQSTSVPGGTGTIIGTGSANTDNIIAQNGAGTTYAAGLARAYTGGGFNDWYLPSLDELEKLYINKDAIGGFASAVYWSSSQNSFTWSWFQDFANSNKNYSSKGSTFRVRAVRSF